MNIYRQALIGEAYSEGKRVAVTGGTTGVGRAIAVLLAAEGAKVFICGRNADHLAEALVHIRDVGEGDGITIDLAEPDHVKAFFRASSDYLGGLDVAIINAAISSDGLGDMCEPDLRYAIANDFTAYVLSAHAAVAALGEVGDIILVGTTGADFVGPNATVHAGIRAGIVGFSEAFSREMGPKGIKVGLIEPGTPDIRWHAAIQPTEQQRDMLAEETSLRAEDIAIGVHFMLTQPRRSLIQQMVVAPRARDR